MHRGPIGPALLLMAELALSACGNDWNGRWTTYLFKVNATFQTPVRLSADGESLGSCSSGGTFTLRRKDRGVRLSRRPQAITAEILTPDGWKPSGNILPDTFAPEWEEKEIQAGRPVEIGLMIHASQQAHDSRMTLVVDNRDHPASQVRVGELRFDIPGGQVWKEEFPGPTTSE